ncbi:MAG: FxsA family protein [Pseudomonadota bacterium]
MRFSLIPLALLIVPVIEISIFVMIGQHIGVLGTVAGVVLTALIGSLLLRFQGFRVFGEINRQMQAGAIPARAMGDAALIVVAALLLLTPGFLTDAIGFSLFIPQIRSAIWSFVAKRITVVGPGGVRFGQDGFGPQSQPDHADDPRDYNPPSDANDAQTIDLDEDDYEDQTQSTTSGQGRRGSGSNSPWTKP